MVGKHIVLTLSAGVGIGVVLWKYVPPVWTPLPITGLILLVVGFVLWTIARFQLGASFSISAQARQLVTKGLYSKIRNPIYVFGSCLMAGVFLYLRRPELLLIFGVVIPLQIVRARKEAQVLEAHFGETYRDYRSRTWF